MSDLDKPYVQEGSKVTFSLDGYQRVNILWMLDLCTSAVMPYSFLNTGDWIGELYWKVRGDEPPTYPNFRENVTKKEIIERVDNWILSKLMGHVLKPVVDPAQVEPINQWQVKQKLRHGQLERQAVQSTNDWGLRLSRSEQDELDLHHALAHSEKERYELQAKLTFLQAQYNELQASQVTIVIPTVSHPDLEAPMNWETPQ